MAGKWDLTRGGNRKMFVEHARQLTEYHCVLIDLPGHGSRMDEALGLESAIKVIIDTVKDHTNIFNGIKPVYVGGSLGGYIGMELLGRHPDLFSAAVIGMAGQNVGVGRGWKAGLGMMAFKLFIPLLPNIFMLKGLIAQANKNENISNDMVNEIALYTGMYFHSGLEQVEILSNTNPLKQLPNFKGRVLFINGSLDHRDSEQLWLKACPNGRLIVYDGADHFFSHDKRFLSRFVQDIRDFLQK
ncbi:hypothetical protein HK103_007426 [Boothiomyces macroporosus]|uniref:AB hydrolase-1 domain-containing protein n=1 Tax=Boothiomyces macroporosus TaxID=261099 RepID=A0AAD5UNK0_9FUNG|nr:hypothetical protein HK103_007426 [Boothiomyces macroporosus]